MARNLKLLLQNNKPAAINSSVEQHTSSKDFKNREYRIGSAISSKGKVSLKACREHCYDKGWYRQSIYIGDLIYILSNAEKYLEFEIEYALGQTRESAISQIKDTFRALEQMDSEVARRKLNDILSINNPILHLLKYMNAIKEKLFETELCNLLSSEDFTHPKTMALVKRNLAITPPKPREKAQRQFEIETSDLKLNSSGEILYICRNCRALTYHPRESFSSSPIKVCRCKGASVPARHLVGYKTNKGIVVQITRTKAKIKTSTGIKELSTDDLIEAELSYLREYKPESVKTFTSLMLWHHQTHNGCCHCVECCSQ